MNEMKGLNFAAASIHKNVKQTCFESSATAIAHMLQLCRREPVKGVSFFKRTFACLRLEKYRIKLCTFYGKNVVVRKDLEFVDKRHGELF